LSRTFCKQTLCEQFWIVKTLINLFLRITSDAEKTPIFVHFEGFKLPLQIRYNYLVAPGRRRVAPSFAFGAPLLVPFSFNFPLYCFGGTSCDEKRNVIVFDTYGRI
jgi:hypothetical protein